MDNTDKKFINTRQIALLGISFAVMLVSLSIPLISQFAFIPLVVLIVLAEKENFKMAVLGGLLFGLASLISAFIIATPFAILFYNPLVSVLPRILTGMIIYAVYKTTFGIFKRHKSLKDINNSDNVLVKRADFIAMSIGGAFGALSNTVLVISAVLLFNFGKVIGSGESALAINLAFVISIIPNAIIELIISALVAPPVVMALKHLRY